MMSSDLEETFNCIYDVRVPPLWGKVIYTKKITNIVQCYIET